MFGITNRLEEVQKLLKINPKAALKILDEDVDAATKELECLADLGRATNEVLENLGYANNILKTKGVDFGKRLDDKEVESRIAEVTKRAVAEIKKAKKKFSELEKYMKKLEE